MRRMLGIEVLQCVQCLATMRAIAVITKAEGIDKILSHVKLAAGPQLTADGYSVRRDRWADPFMGGRRGPRARGRRTRPASRLRRHRSSARDEQAAGRARSVQAARRGGADRQGFVRDRPDSAIRSTKRLAEGAASGLRTAPRLVRRERAEA